VVIVADDLGYGDLGFQGGKDIPTPNLDALAAGGVRFTNAYVSCPVCSPTRAGIMTGRYQQRFGHEFNPGSPNRPRSAEGVVLGLPLSQTTLADAMKAAGHATGMVGKWHLGAVEGYVPQDRGFDEFFGFLGGAHPYVNLKASDAQPIYRGRTPVDESAYLTEAFGREAAAFIDGHKEHPFFLYLPFNAVHGPMQANPADEGRFSSIAEAKRRTYASMLSSLDTGVGVVLDKLREAGLESNTIVFFISDNGGPTGVNASTNTPLSGNKGSVWEGGIRVPMVIRWPDRIKAGTYDQPVIGLDIRPTAMAAVGASSSGQTYDGVNLLPFLAGETSGPPHEHLFWRFGAQRAVRAGEWKLMWQNDEAGRLYNLADDMGEKTDLAQSRPEIVARLTAAYDQWNSQNAAPLWGAAGRRARGGNR
jgi:arylsulfatase A-like enzyme